jgi:hypothetical protein
MGNNMIERPVNIIAELYLIGIVGAIAVSLPPPAGSYLMVGIVMLYIIHNPNIVNDVTGSVSALVMIFNNVFGVAEPQPAILPGNT